MLIELFGENFGSFRDEFRLSLVATDIDPESERGVVEVQVNGDPDPLHLLRAVAIYGPNASGKSTVLRAASALGWILRRGGQFASDDPIPFFEPFAGSDEAPVRLGIKALIAGNVYDYEVSFDRRQIVRERLDKQQLDGPLTLFERERQRVDGLWTADDQFRLITREFRVNAVLLSLTDTLAPGLTGTLVPDIANLLNFSDPASASRLASVDEESTANLAASDPEFQTWLAEQLRAADVGVTDLRIEKMRLVRSEQGTLFEELTNEDDKAGDRKMGRVTHRIALQHAGPAGTFGVPYYRESLGTRKLVGLARLLYSLSSARGSTAAFVDEIGASLHPTLLAALIEHINCRSRGAEARGQLIFATHETSLIDEEAKASILRRDQVYFTEKGKDGVSRLFSLADFRERQTANLRKRYLEGRYGAIPSIGPFPGRPS